MDNSNVSIKSENNKVHESPEKVDFLALVGNLISNLPTRTGDILKKRYGIGFEEGETLEKIGQEYKITRERVRQIISDAVRNISNRSDDASFARAEKILIFTIESSNGIIKEKDLAKKFNLADSQFNAVKFLADCSKRIQVFAEKGAIEQCLVLDESIIGEVKKVISEAEKILDRDKKVMTDEQIINKISAVLPGLSNKKIIDCLSVSFKIKKNRFGKWGKSDWAEISPKGTREKIYLVLKEKKSPLHFTKIAELIDEYALGKKKAHPQTVHNELIKDGRFVLIGRGIYALSEWGYSEGTIKDVLKNILEDSARPLDKEEILERVFKVRKVKKATVMINLNNSNLFERNKNTYTVKK